MNDTTTQFLQENFTQKAIESLTQLSGGGSARVYTRFFDQNQSYILAESSNIEENKVFIQFTLDLKKVINNIPEIVSSNKHFIRFKNGCYILSYSPTQDSNATRGFYFNTIIVNDMQKFNMNSLHDVFEFIKLYKNNQQCILHSTEISIEILLKYKHFYKTVVDDVY